MNEWSDDAFIALMKDVWPEEPIDIGEPVDLAAERQKPEISWAEFAGNYQ
ncbi:hypothetical protein JK232_02425 [Nissabacter archeti]|uniref:Uncharacterized protein n=1 Tax=Nissabacter archeti TaxID=1917880 RepID=A0ABS5JCR7_9GAMM|nr:hypothetical protein [Nissabacter archeti]MBS0967740.1 hypothetical protein [Nissabacter archeti]